MNKKFENIKKALVTDKPIHMDKEALWQSIEREMDTDKKRRRPIFFIIILAGIGLSATGYVFWQSRNTPKPKTQPKVEMTALDSSSLAKVKTTTTLSDKKSIVEELSSEEERKSVSALDEEDIAENFGRKNISASENARISNKSHVDQPISAKPSNLIKRNRTEKRVNILHGQITEDKVNTKKFYEGNPATLEMNSDDLSNQTEKVNTEIQSRELVQRISLLPIVERLSIHSLVISKNEIGKPLVVDKVKIKKPRTSWELYFSSGVNIWDKFGQKSSPELDAISQKRNAISSPKESYTAMMMLKKQVLPNMFIGLGLQYNQFTELIQAADIRVTTTDILSDSASYYVGASGVDYIAGSLKQTNRQGFLIYSPNSIRRWNIPLELSYRYKLGRMHLVPSASLVYTVSQIYSGIHIGMDGSFIYKNNQAFRDIYKSSGIVAWSLAMDAEWTITHAMAIKLGITNQHDLSSALRAETFISERYRQFGMRIGLVKTFGLE